MRRLGPVLLLAFGIACSSPDDARGPDSAFAEADTSGKSSPPASLWAPELGPVLLVPADADSLALVLPALPDSSTAAPASVTLLNAAGSSMRVRAERVSSDSLQCGNLQIVHLTGGTLPGWTVGLQDATTAPIVMDSIQSLGRGDSARVSAALVRIASGIPARADSAEGRFNALPFTVTRARMLRIDSRDVVIAHLLRRVPQESAPLEEHTFLIVERAAQSPDSAYRLAYQRQSSGTEETAEYFDVLTVARGSGGSTLLLFSIDRASGTTYVLLSRSASGAWRSVWERLLAC